MLVTILTPSYNRGHLLQRCYDSLLKQKNQDFEWIVVNDGSTDSTEEILEKFREEGKIQIRILKKRNGGKHTAINYAMQYACGIFTLILDSDDWLMDNAIEAIQSYYLKYKEHKEICVFKFACLNADGSRMRTDLQRDEWIESPFHYKRDTKNDSACDVIYTKCLKEYPFPEFPGEKYIGESYIWNQMAQKYKYLFLNTPIYYREYQSGGLTAEGRLLRIKNPAGGMAYAWSLMLPKAGLKRRIKGAVLFYCYSKFAERKYTVVRKYYDKKGLELIGIIGGTVLYHYWNGKYLKGEND